jgi:hypothetical protein
MLTNFSPVALVNKMLNYFKIINFSQLPNSIRNLNTTACTQQSFLKQVSMIKKIMVGREKGKRRFVYEENKIPKMQSVEKLSNPKGQGKESNRRITVLNKLFMKNVTDLMASGYFGDTLFGYGLQVREIKFHFISLLILYNFTRYQQ